MLKFLFSEPSLILIFEISISSLLVLEPSLFLKLFHWILTFLTLLLWLLIFFDLVFIKSKLEGAFLNTTDGTPTCFCSESSFSICNLCLFFFIIDWCCLSLKPIFPLLLFEFDHFLRFDTEFSRSFYPLLFFLPELLEYLSWWIDCAHLNITTESLSSEHFLFLKCEFGYIFDNIWEALLILDHWVADHLNRLLFLDENLRGDWRHLHGELNDFGDHYLWIDDWSWGFDDLFGSDWGHLLFCCCCLFWRHFDLYYY